ncbi:MAG: hypothetical protein JO329_05810, partial [Planctomycetaceae bacterium]|nr:hypothetical protein [Planctomycetaceae bacterium]
MRSWIAARTWSRCPLPAVTANLGPRPSSTQPIAANWEASTTVAAVEPSAWVAAMRTCLRMSPASWRTTSRTIRAVKLASRVTWPSPWTVRRRKSPASASRYSTGARSSRARSRPAAGAGGAESLGASVAGCQGGASSMSLSSSARIRWGSQESRSSS